MTKRLILTVGMLVFLGAGCVMFQPTVPPQHEPVACTMEAKLCPDGSYVARSGPKCEFAACPAPNPNITCGDTFGTCGKGYQCIQKCGPPVVREGDAPPGFYCATDEVASKPRMCPICLAANTMIQTPSGDVNVTELKKGAIVWSVDAQGKRVAAAILEVAKTPVSKTHQVVHLALKDGREVWVSPQHPLINGKPIISLKVGDGYDGSIVMNTKLEAYTAGFTYDLLPDSASSIYVANGIPLRSTLVR